MTLIAVEMAKSLCVPMQMAMATVMFPIFCCCSELQWLSRFWSDVVKMTDSNIGILVPWLLPLLFTSVSSLIVSPQAAQIH